MLDDPIQALDKKTNLGIDQYPEQVRALTAKVKSSTAQFTMDALLMANNTMTFLLSCPVFIFFMLISRSQIRKCYYNSFKPEKRAIANRILQQIEMVYISYIRGLFYVMFIVSVLTAIGLYALGIDYAIFLGILAGILTLIPYVGVFISALIPAVIALLTKDSMWYVVGVIGIFALVQFLEGNFFTPKIMGDQVGLNPLVVIISIIIFGAIGGIVGMILTVPILAFLKTIAFYIKSWRPFRYLLQANK
jgi:predicted PurR-regulated permease PerM